MGCGASTQDPYQSGGGAGVRNDEPAIDPITVTDIETGYPAPVAPPNSKDDIYKDQDYASIDERVKQQHSRMIPSSYETLIKALTTGCTTDLQKLRAIFVWLYLQDIHGSFYNKVTDPNTPKGYMKLIKTQNGSYTSFFAQLCRAADIPCNVIRGIGKGDKYVIGQQDTTDMECSWNAAYVAGGWRFVHPLWAFFQEKQTYEDGRRPPAGTKRPSIHEFYWLIDPNKLICFCKPHADPWQLLKTRWEKTKFLRSPHFTEDYFGCGLLLPKKYSAIITSDTGICVIEFDHQNYEEPVLNAEVEFMEETSSDNMPEDAELNEYVAKASSSTRKTLIVRFPVRGKYKTCVSGGLDSRKPKIVEFILDCEDIGRNPQPFPSNPEEGFGMAAISSQFGISDPVPDNGIVLVRPFQQKHFSFTCTQKLEVEALLIHRRYDSDRFADFITTRTSDGEVHISVTVPDETILEYALQIAVRPEHATRNFAVVANYLLVDENWKKKTAVVAPSKISTNDEERIRKALIAATQKNDIARLEKAIEEFQHHGLYDNGDLYRARNKLVQLHLQNLRKTTLDRKLDELEAAIDSAKKSNVAPEVVDSKEMTEAETTRLQLKRLKLYMHKVLALNKATISELHSYQRPRPLVHQVMKATFRILGEPTKKLQDWTYVQASMRRLGRNSMLGRMRRCDVVNLKQRQVDDAEGFLGETNKHLVRMCSAGAGTFYVWSNNMIAEYQGRSEYDPLDITDSTNKWEMGKKKDGQMTNRSFRQTAVTSTRNESKARALRKSNEKPKAREVDDIEEGKFDDTRYSDHWDPNAPSVYDRKSRV